MNLPMLSWRQKLIATSLLCLVLPSIVALALTGLQSKSELKKKAVFKAEQSLEVSDLYVTNLVNDIIAAVNSLQYDSEMTTELRTAWTKYDLNREADFFSTKKITEKLDNFTFFRDRTYVTILLHNGLYFTNYSTYNSDMSYLYEEPWLKQMELDPINTTRWFGNHDNYVKFDVEDYPHLITVVRTFKLYAKSPNAYIIISKPEELFHQIFSKYVPDQIMMKDENGHIVSHSNPDFLGLKVPPSFAKGRDNLVVWHDVEYMAVEHPLKFADWSMQSLTATKDITGRVGSFMNASFVIQVIFFIVFSIIMIYLLRQLTNPIMRLARAASNVKAGNLNVRSNIHGKDEIGQLGLSFDRMLERIKEMIDQVEWEQSRKRIVELELIQAQINPHFLFNILNSIRLQVMMKGEEEIAQIIGSLSTLLRMTINRNNEFLPLHEEVATVEHYIKLMNFRHSEGIELTVNLASNTLLESIPRFTLQPLIENAYIHGLGQRHGEIIISAHKLDGHLYIMVQDNGKGMTERELQDVLNSFSDRTQGDSKDSVELVNSAESNRSALIVQAVSGIGLRIVNERLLMIYGSAYKMDLVSKPGEGLKITIRIPISANKEETGHV